MLQQQTHNSFNKNVPLQPDDYVPSDATLDAVAASP
jgi:hypothetical protein